MKLKLSTFALASAVMAAAALATIPAVAETSITLNVPFSFTVGSQSLPAGSYSVKRDDRGNFVRLQGKDASQSFVWVASTADTKTDRVILKFDANGRTHVLESVQCGPLVTPRLDRKNRNAEDMSPEYVPGQ
jgi:hypothetical protein